MFAKTPCPRSGCIIIRRNVCEVSTARGLPSPERDVSICYTRNVAGPAYHFERIELFLDLLREHRGEPVASRDISSAVVIVG